MYRLQQLPERMSLRRNQGGREVEDMIISINGIPCTCEKGEFILTVARRNGIKIPTLCSHKALGEQGACRVCIVEVEEGGKKKIVTACVYPISRECSVETDSERVREERGIILALLRCRAPESQEIRSLCEEFNAPELKRLQPLPSGKCVLCGLCVRACRSLGAGAINTMLRGTEKLVGTPYDEPSPDCIGCGSCAEVCPTGHIVINETAETRTIWGKTFTLVHCDRCGAIIGTPEELAHSAKHSGQPVPTLCENCRKLRITDEMAHTYGTSI